MKHKIARLILFLSLIIFLPIQVKASETMNITKMYIDKNSMSRPGLALNKVTAIVVHWVGNAGSTATANRNYFNNLKNQSSTYASAHYIIGLNGEIIQCIPENEIAYHATTANSYSIGIENCHPDSKGKFNQYTYNSLVELCSNICKRYSLNPTTAMKRHYDISGKICPKYYVENEAAWKQLIYDVKQKMNNDMEKIYINGVAHEIKTIIEDNITYVPLRQYTLLLGGTTEYDVPTKTKKITI